MFVGNDIVDLRATETVHDRFARRVMTALEFEDYKSLGKTESFLWHLWAAKEAAYKLEKQRDASTIFSHAAFSFDHIKSEITFGGRKLSINFENNDHYVYCFCSEGVNRVENLIKICEPEPQQSAVVRDFARQKIAELFGLGAEQVTISKSKHRVPIAHGPSGPLPCAVSLTHHGSYVGVAIGLA